MVGECRTDRGQQGLAEVLRGGFIPLDEATVRLQPITVEMLRVEAWDKMREEVSYLNLIVDLIREALDAFEGKE